jgi:hypothetical protein
MQFMLHHFPVLIVAARMAQADPCVLRALQGRNG